MPPAVCPGVWRTLKRTSPIWMISLFCSSTSARGEPLPPRIREKVRCSTLPSRPASSAWISSLAPVADMMVSLPAVWSECPWVLITWVRIDQSADSGVFVSNQVTEIGHFNQPDLLYLHLFLFGLIDIHTDETYVNAKKYHGIRF